MTLPRLATGKNYMFRMCSKNSAGSSDWVGLGPVCCAANVEDPKVVLPRALKKQLKINVGEKLHINVPFQGAPKPIVSWTKLTEKIIEPEPEPVPEPAAEPAEPAPAEGEEAPKEEAKPKKPVIKPKAAKPAPPPEPVWEESALDAHFTVRTAADSSVIFLRNADRADTGRYKIKVTSFRLQSNLITTKFLGTSPRPLR